MISRYNVRVKNDITILYAHINLLSLLRAVLPRAYRRYSFVIVCHEKAISEN